MNLPIRSILALSLLVIILAACGTTADAPAATPPVPTAPAEPTVAPTEVPSQAPSEAPDPAPEAPREVAGTISLFEGSISGPGGSIQEVLDLGPSGEYPTLANGVLFRDTDGKVYLATSVSDVTAPTFEGPMLEVTNIPNDGPSWDMAQAELLGLEEANGIVFNPESQIGGYLEIN
jgi:hypothetical protein